MQDKVCKEGGARHNQIPESEVPDSPLAMQLLLAGTGLGVELSTLLDASSGTIFIST